MGKSYWMWHDGDYEVFHYLRVHTRREERGYIRPAYWKLATPYPTVKFKKHVCGEGGYLKCHLNGEGYVSVDKKLYCADEYIKIPAGNHLIKVQVANPVGLPAAYVESDVCPSNESWICSHFAGEYTPVGCQQCFDDPKQTPETFPFAYKRKQAVVVEQGEQGNVYDFGEEIFGFVDITNADPSQTIKIYYGESKEEALDTDYSYITDRVSKKMLTD